MVNPAIAALLVLVLAAPGCRTAGETRAAHDRPAQSPVDDYRPPREPRPPAGNPPAATTPLPTPDELWDKLARALERAEFIRGEAYEELLDILEVLGAARVNPPASESEIDEVERVRQRAAELLEELPGE